MDGKKLIETTCKFCGNDLAHGFDSLEEYIDLILEKGAIRSGVQSAKRCLI